MSLNENTALQDLSVDERAELERIADLFFEGIDPVFRDPSGIAAQDRYQAMLLIHNYVFDRFADESKPVSILTKSRHYPYTAAVRPGKLEYCYDIFETTCYDGGCYSPDSISSYLCIELVSEQQLQSAKEKPDDKWELRKWRWFLRKQYWERFPDESRSEYVRDGRLYLSHPFQTAFNLSICFTTA